MHVTRLDDWNCSIARTLDVVGEWWTPLILRDAFRGTRRFDDFHASLGMARSVLTARLGKLTDHGILERHRYSEHPPRCEYRLTEKGLALFPVIAALMQWGDTWASGRPRPRHLRERHPAGADLPALPRRSQPRQHPQRTGPGKPPVPARRRKA
jgi:DNA-binding HxlR family transcriptional regulator